MSEHEEIRDPLKKAQSGPFVVDFEARSIAAKGGVPIALTPKHFRVLEVLWNRAQQTVKPATFLEEAWPETTVAEGSVTVAVKNLRKSLGDDHPFQYIQTDDGGYRWALQVERTDPEQPPRWTVEPPWWVWVVVVLAIAAAVGLLSLRDRRVEITGVGEGIRTPTVEGRVSNPEDEVVLVVHPEITASFHVQNPVNVRPDGSWSSVVFLGDDSTPIGTGFEIRAFVNPTTTLQPGAVLSTWPDAEANSEIAFVIRTR